MNALHVPYSGCFWPAPGCFDEPPPETKPDTKMDACGEFSVAAAGR